MAKILVTGANGQVGSELRFLSETYPSLTFVFVDIEELDITNAMAVNDFIAAQNFDYCVNCAAYTAVDKAESNQEIATKVNVIGAANLSKAMRNTQGRCIQISTDYVYHNKQNTPFKESDITNPQSVYATTKLEGDNITLENDPSALVLRTSWVYSSFGHNFVKTMLRLGKERDALGIVFDQIGTPTYARDLAKAILEIISKIENGLDTEGGIYHYSNEGVCSWYDFALAIFDIEGISCKVNPIETTAYPTPAKRPPFSVLNKAKIKSTFDLEIPHWRASLIDCISELRA